MYDFSYMVVDVGNPLIIAPEIVVAPMNTSVVLESNAVFKCIFNARYSSINLFYIMSVYFMEERV